MSKLLVGGSAKRSLTVAARKGRGSFLLGARIWARHAAPLGIESEAFLGGGAARAPKVA